MRDLDTIAAILAETERHRELLLAIAEQPPVKADPIYSQHVAMAVVQIARANIHLRQALAAGEARAPATPAVRALASPARALGWIGLLGRRARTGRA